MVPLGRAGLGRAEGPLRRDGSSFEWRIALMRPRIFPSPRAQCDWFYRRSGGTVMRSPVHAQLRMVREGARRATTSAEPRRGGRPGFRRSLTTGSAWPCRQAASEIEGRKIGRHRRGRGRRGQGDRASPPGSCKARAESAAVRARVDASTAEFFSHRITQRPAFILEDAIGDKAVFSGLVRHRADRGHDRRHAGRHGRLRGAHRALRRRRRRNRPRTPWTTSISVTPA